MGTGPFEYLARSAITGGLITNVEPEGDASLLWGRRRQAGAAREKELRGKADVPAPVSGTVGFAMCRGIDI